MTPADTSDTPIITAGTRGWSGVTNRVKAALVGDDQLTTLVNGRLDDTGSVQLRPGTEWLGRPSLTAIRGMAYLDVPGTEAALAMSAGSIYEIPADRQPVLPVPIAGAVLASSGPYTAAQLVDKLAIADGLRVTGLWREYGAWQTIQVTSFSDGSLLPPVQHVLAHAFRLFIAGGRGADAETVYGSDVLDPWTISNTIGMRVGRGEGDPITALRPGPGQKFFALKGASCWWIDTTGTVDQWQCDSVTMHLGCWAGATAVAVNQDVIFLSRRGVAQLGRLSNDAPVAPADLLSAPIEATIRRINWSAARRTACATLWREYYLLAVPLDGSHSNNAVLAYNTATKQWSGEWTGLAPSAWCQTGFDGQTETLLGTTTGAVLRLDPERTTDDGETTQAAIPLELETQAYAYDAPDLQKIPSVLDVEWRESTATVDVMLRADGGSPQTIAEDFAAAAAAGTVNQRLIANLRELEGGRELQIRMVTTGGAFGLRELALKALLLRARSTPPPAELLIAPIPAEDDAGTEVELRDSSGGTFTMQLQEIDTVTLPHDSLDFVCFRGGLSIPAGSYVIAYRDGYFTETDLIATHDLEDETLGPGWTFTGGTAGWSGPLQTLSIADYGADSGEAYPEGARADLYLGFGWAPGLGSAILLEMERGYDSLETYTVGAAPALTAGTTWAAAGTTQLIENPYGTDSLESYSEGSGFNLSAGTGWSGNAALFIAS